MPSKRTNDSVDEILQELGRQQAAQDVQGSIADRQVDDILRSVGMYEDVTPASAELGPIAAADMPAVELGQEVPQGEAQRFSTQILDDLLKDLPSLRAAQSAQPAARPARPAPAAQPAAPARHPRRPVQAQPAEASRPAVQKAAQAAPAQPAPAQAEPPQPAPAQPAPAPQAEQPAPVQPAPAPQAEQPAPRAPADLDASGLGDTTRSGIIKNFLLKMSPDAADASQGALNEGKREFQRFFGQSAAVVPDEKGHLKAPARKKRGFFGLGSVEDSQEFVPINVSLTGLHTDDPAEEDSAEALPEIGGLYGEEAPARKGLFARLFGKKDTEELYIPESREPEKAAPAHRGVVLEEDGEADSLPAGELSMQLPVEAIRSRYTAGRGNGLDMPPALSLPKEEPARPDVPAEDDEYSEEQILADLGYARPELKTGELALDLSGEADPFAHLDPEMSTMEFLRQQEAQAAAQARPAPAAQPGGVYRKKRTTVEFTPGQSTRKQARPAAEPATGPVGEPVMTESGDAPAPSTGFTMKFDTEPGTQDTQLFLDAYREARSLHSKAAAPEAAPAAPTTGEVLLDAASGSLPPEEEVLPPAPAEQAAPAPQAPPAGEEPRAAQEPRTAQFVQGIAQSINAPEAAPEEAENRFLEAARRLTDTSGELPPEGTAPLRLDGVPADEQTGTPTSPFVAAPHAAQHSYEKPEDEPAVRRDLDRQVLVLGVSTIVGAVLALVMLYLGIAAFGGAPLPPPLALAAGKAPLLATMLVLLVAACGLSWRTLLWGVVGMVRSPTPDSMPALAALAAVVQLVVFLAVPDLYDPTRFCLLGGAAALLLCANTAGKAMDAQALRAGFGLVSAKREHAVARRLVDSGMLQAATRGLAEPRPCVLISRPTELFKGFLTSATARRPNDKNQQQLARVLLGCALLSVAFTLIYHRDAGKAVTALAAVLCLGTPLAGTLISALPAYLMQRSAAKVGAVIPGWHDIRQLGRINVIHLTTHDLFPDGSVRLCGIKPVHKEQIDRAITYAASLLALGCPSMQNVFLGMIGGNRKLLAKVDDFENVYGKGYVGWIDGERVLAGNRDLMEEYGVKIPSLEYEQRYTVNQRRFVYLAVSGKLLSVFQVAYQCDPDTAAVLENLRQGGMSLVVERDDFNCDAPLLEALYNLPAGTVKVLTAEEYETLEPGTAWLPESSGNMLHLGSFASFVGGLQAAAGAAAGERQAGMVLTASVLLSVVLGLVMSVPAMGITALPLPALVLYQVAWAVLALIFPMIRRY